MVAVRINGSEAPLRTDGLGRVSDLVELIKSLIDPDHMITSIMVDGRDLEDMEWEMNPTQFGTKILEVETGTPEQFVRDRLSQSADVVRTCYMEFRGARKCFQCGDMHNGNQGLLRAVNILKAFFEWYGTISELVPVDRRSSIDMASQTTDITETCKRICQQQLYQSWWALGETIEKELEPKLDKLEDFCRKACQMV
jgi:hypothetical protein